MIMPAPWRRWADPAPMSGLVISRCAITELTVDLGHCGCGGPETRAPAVPLTPRADSVLGASVLSGFLRRPAYRGRCPASSSSTFA